jgi:hypothetical protein
MTTVRAFLSEAEAALALSRLEAAGIEAFLADAISLAVIGAGTSAVSIRLQVPDEEAERAGRILRGEEGAGPLPDDFVPPEQPPSPTNDLARLGRGDIAAAFTEGGIYALIVLGLPALSALACGGKLPASWGGILFLFLVGGVAGVFVLACRKNQENAGER